jgi:hypothetical protein
MYGACGKLMCGPKPVKVTDNNKMTCYSFSEEKKKVYYNNDTCYIEPTGVEHPQLYALVLQANIRLG